MAGNDLRARALRLLATREHSRVELKRKLEARARLSDRETERVPEREREGDEADTIEALLDRLAETGLQSDARFAESYVRSKGGRLGTARLRRELSDRGVTEELVNAALGEALPEDDLARARGVWAKKFGTAPQDRNEWARQARFLQSRGFSGDVIRKLLKEPFDESAQS